MPNEKASKLESILSGIAGHYLVAAELSRRGYIATPTLRNTRGIDVLASSADGTKAITIQVKTNQHSSHEWLLSAGAESLISDSLFYVFVNLNGYGKAPTFHIVPSKTVADYVRQGHEEWLSGRKKDGTERKDTAMRKFKDHQNKYLDRWDLLGLGRSKAG
jgi:hypothetical protein